MWEGHIMSNDLMMILEVMKEQSLFSLDSESRLHILRWPKTTTQRLKLPTEWEVSWSLPLANQWTSSMNFIHAVDGTEARGNSVNEEIDRDCIFSEGRGSPQRLADSQKKEIRRLPKKGVSDSLRKWCKLGLICSEILYKSSRFAHPLNPLRDSSSLSSSPSELPASVLLKVQAIASPFSSKDIGHMPRPSRTPKR